LSRSLLSFFLGLLLISASALSQPVTGQLRGQVLGNNDAKTRWRPLTSPVIRFDSQGKESVFANGNQWGEYTVSLPPGLWEATAVYDKDGKAVELLLETKFSAEVSPDKVGTLNIATLMEFPDELTILKVEPVAVVDGIETEFTVEVAYRLVSVPEGEVQIGFNTIQPMAYTMTEAEPIEAGAGTLMLKAKVVPRDWKEKNHFRVFVNLSERKKGHQYFPFAGDEKTIDFKNDGKGQEIKP